VEYKSRVPSVIENEPMAKHTSFRIGGPARMYVVAVSSDALIEAVRVAQDLEIPFYVFGGGSNLLVADEGFEGVVIQAANRGFVIEHDRVQVESGMITVLAARKTVDAGLTGFEWAVGVPGTIGGALYGNAGCYGGEMKDNVSFVDAYRLKDGVRIRLSNAECQYGYRDSLFKREPHVILGCELKLIHSSVIPAEDFGERHSAELSRSLSRTAGIHPTAPFDQILRARKESQPLDQSSAGCVFKNFDFTDESQLDILRRHVDQIPEAMLRVKRLSAGWLVEQAGMKDQRIGDVQVSDKHGNFFLNRGHARAQDVIALISLVKMNVRDKLGIELQEEVQYLSLS
ncbi:MAG: UDP-N-acetylmuramate dehydrogenase, partial [Candidatus Uhrbacteria bacterium]|nr:UDP-N-acetylmuramate dehydrogenase [Candidatus Uhrbacteria bacterium]